MTSCFAKYPLEELYKEFNEDADETHDSYCSNARKDNNSYNGIHKICKKLVKNLEKISNNVVRNKSGIDLCSYLKYWVSNEVFQIVPSDKYWRYSTIISKLIQPWRDHNHHITNPITKCDYSTNSRLSGTQNIGKLNELNNYIHNIKYIRNKIKSTDLKDKKMLLYRNCNKLFTDMEIYDPQTLLKELQCNESQLSKPELQTDVDRHSPLSGEETVDSKSTENSSFSIFLIFAPIVGVFTVSLILFKLTPRRFLLHKHLIKNKRIEENINDEVNSISIESSFEDIDVNMSKSPIHITYQQL
ncbi:PIR protein [Plasmodium ovale]|uniref:PIR protein n=1 Tax=Plasmodium ovale TaxID=36330 RepID=A0A1C3KI86_PLAOA|nr:PIR protein [Plasmodium ovale]